jgi:AcrR family transcriptional regulator
MKQKRDKGLATRQHIVATATRRFAESGFAATSIEALLGELGISRGALYHHFASKEALFAAVLEAVESEVAARTVAAGRGLADPVARLRAGCFAWLRLAQEPAVRQVVLTDAPAVVGWQAWRAIDARHGFGLLRGGLRAAAEQGRLPAELVEVAAHILLAAVIEAALVIAGADDRRRTLRLAETAIGRLIDGMIGKAGQPP